MKKQLGSLMNFRYCCLNVTRFYQQNIYDVMVYGYI